MNITKQMLKKCFAANRPIGKWLIHSGEFSPSLILFPDVNQLIGSDYWSVFIAVFFQHREIKIQPIQLSNSENPKFTHDQNSGRKAKNNQVVINRKKSHGFAIGSSHLFNHSLKRAAKLAHENNPLNANSSEKIGDRKLAYKCKPIRADFEFNEFLRGSPPKSENHPFRLFQSKFANRRS